MSKIVCYYWREEKFVGELHEEEGLIKNVVQLLMMHGQDEQGQVGTALHMIKMGIIYVESTSLIIELSNDSPIYQQYEKLTSKIIRSVPANSIPQNIRH